jgi:perosamine synthetase
VCRSVRDAIQASRATAVLSDIGDDWCINASTIKKVITKRTKAIVVANIYGIVANFHSLREFELPLIEDCCQSIGASRNGQKAGTFGTVGILSFSGTKVMTAGEGGMVVTNDSSILAKIKELKRGKSGTLQYRSRTPMSNLQALLGMNQLRSIDRFVERRHEIAASYFDLLNSESIILPEIIRNRSNFFRYPIRFVSSKLSFDLIKELAATDGIAVRRGVDTLLHRLERKPAEDYINAERLYRETISLPIYPLLNDDGVKAVVSVVQKVLG